jgi:hypothetical protein
VRGRQQPAVAGDELKGPVVGEAQVVDAGGGGVQQPQPDPLAAHVQVRVVGAVDQQLVPQPADRAERRLTEIQRPVGGEPLVLQDDGDVVDAVAVGQRQRAGLRVLHQEQPGHPTVDVVLGALVGVGVVPQGGRGLVDRPARRPSGARLDRLVGAAVRRGGQVHAVPVDRGRLRQAVSDVDGDPVAAGGAQGGAQVGAVGTPRLGWLTGQQLAGAGLEAQVEQLTAGAVHAGLQQRRDLQLALEAELANVAHVGLGPEPGGQPGQPEHADQPTGKGPAQQAHQQPLATSHRAIRRHGHCGGEVADHDVFPMIGGAGTCAKTPGRRTGATPGRVTWWTSGVENSQIASGDRSPGMLQ